MKVFLVLLLAGSMPAAALPTVRELPADTGKVRLRSVDVVGQKGNPGQQPSTVILQGKTLRSFGSVTGSVESLIKTLPGVVGQDELSSQYNVRGGNYDENLLYINGFEVFRPILARSGQQEGLSAVHPDLVGSLQFQAGGFGATYGDKLASVLDVTYSSSLPAAKLDLGLLGQSAVVSRRDQRGGYQALAVRNRTNTPWLGGLDTRGDFRSRMNDVQWVGAVRLTDEQSIDWIALAGSNDYRVVPQSRETEFGTVSEVLRLNVYFEGQERYTYQTGFGGVRWRKTNERRQWELRYSRYRADEQERADVVSAYRLGELNANLGSDQFGEISYWRGTGGYQRYARNRLFSDVQTLRGQWNYKTDGLGQWTVGVEGQYQRYWDALYEWENLDSAGYSLPHRPTGVFVGPTDTVYVPTSQMEVYSFIQDRAYTPNVKASAYVEWAHAWDGERGRWTARGGVRAQAHTRNGEVRISPRAAVSWDPAAWPSWSFRAAGGWYHQPVGLREMRSWAQAELLTQRESQQAVHAILAGQKTLWWSGRPFLWVTELYAKSLQRLIPYDQDGLRLRYAPESYSRGVMAGWDNRLHGEFIPGTESWLSLSFFRALEDLEGDDAGWIRRPTDQRYSFGLQLEDKLPKDPSVRVQATFTLVGGFPFGAPGGDKATQVFQTPPYRRMDLAFFKVFKDPASGIPGKPWNRAFEKLSVGIDVFNLLEIRNTASYFWVMDISTARYYAVPNYLTNRLFNLKAVASF
jgi:hypothetical protein